MAKHSREKPRSKDLVNAAIRAGLKTRTKGGHLLVTMPDGTVVVLTPPGRAMPERHLDDQTKRFIEAGLWPPKKKEKEIGATLMKVLYDRPN